jgi:hypothetical protein
LAARLAGELPAMVVRRYRIGKCQGQGIGKIGRCKAPFRDAT